MSLDEMAQRQQNLGPAGFFRPTAEDPPGNQVVVKAGFAYRPGFSIEDQFTGGDQTTAGFSSVASGAGFKRYDLVYIDSTGSVQIAQGVDVVVAAADFTGAPGFTGGPNLPDQINPVAYVLITEAGAVTVTNADITQLNGFLSIPRSLEGFQVDKGLLGSAPTGSSDVVTALMVGETPGGSSTQRGVVTTDPLNYVQVVDKAGDEIQHNTGGTIYGRLTEAATVWTLSYYYLNATGDETAVIAIETDTSTPTPTDIRMLGTPKVYSSHDPARPLFPSSVQRLQDQVVSTPGIGSVPVGGCIQWRNPAATSVNPTPPTGYEYCDGTVVTTVGSTMLGATKPDVMVTPSGGNQRFVRGADVTATYGEGTALVTGGSDTGAGGSTGPGSAHSHTLGGHTHSFGGHTHSLNAHTHVGGSHQHTINNDAHTHSGTAPAGTIAGGVASISTYNHAHGGLTVAGGTVSTGPPSVTDTGSGSGSSGGPSTGSDPESTHTHSLAGGGDNRPVFVELAMIMRVL